MQGTFTTIVVVLATGLAFCSAHGSHSHSENVDEKDVLVLTPENFDKTIAENKKVLVEFYAPWCGHCKQLVPHYAKAATTLKTVVPDVILAKVDADQHKELGTKYGVKGFPTLKWFDNGNVAEYSGGRTDETIVSWIKKRMGPATKALASTAEHDEFVASADVVVVGYFEDATADNKAWSALTSTALELESVEVAHAGPKALHEHAGFKEGDIVLYKKLDGGHKLVYDGKASASKLKEWVGIHQLPYVNDFSPDNAPKIFGSPIKSQVLLFADKTVEGYAAMRAQLEATGKEFLGRTVAVYVGPDNAQVLSYFGVTDSMLPCVFAVTMPEEGSRGQMKRFKGPDAAELATEGALAKFVGEVLDGKLMPHRCGHCKQLVPIYDKLGEAFKDVPSVVIAKMDATANDPPDGTDVQGFPTIKFYKSGAKSRPVAYDGDRTFKAMRKFIRKNAGVAIPKKAGKGKASKSEL